MKGCVMRVGIVYYCVTDMERALEKDLLELHDRL
jgi:hypothetical protein